MKSGNYYWSGTDLLPFESSTPVGVGCLRVVNASWTPTIVLREDVFELPKDQERAVRRIKVLQERMGIWIERIEKGDAE